MGASSRVFFAMLGMLAWISIGTARADTLLYTLTVPDGESITYEFEIDVIHPGTLQVDAEWTGSRVLSFRLQPLLRGAQVVRRSGPPPQRIEAAVAPGPGGAATWRFSIFALAARGAAEGRITVTRPDDPNLAPVAKTPSEVEPEPRQVPAWAVAKPIPNGIPRDWAQWLESMESLRDQVVGPEGEGAPDSCRWQSSLLSFLDDTRESLVSEGRYPARNTRELLQSIVETVGRIEMSRHSDDPVITGPPPRDPTRRKIWLRQRREHSMRLEADLDEITDLVRRNHAPELGSDTWPIRLVSCVTACQRHFEERVRLGEERASNGDLTRAQWDVILAAGEVLDRLAELEPSTRRDNGS